MSTLWLIVIFFYILSLVKSIWTGIWRAVFNVEFTSSFSRLDLGSKILLTILALIVEFLIYYGMAHFLIWWIGV